MKNNYYYFKGDTYSLDVLPYLELIFPHINFILISEHDLLDPNISKWIILSPTVNLRGNQFLKSLPAHFKTALLLDWNFQYFQDVDVLLNTDKISLIFSPFEVNTSIPLKLVKGLHGEMMKTKVVISSDINSIDYFFCSQPLLEDRPELGFTQFDLLREVIFQARQKGVRIFIKRHPREKSEFPSDIDSKNIIVWSESIELALSKFSIWYGLNSIALHDAKGLGHTVNFMNYSKGKK